MTCDSCGNPSTQPTCAKCLGYQEWASSSRGDQTPGGTTDPKLRQRVHDHLAVIPDLCTQLTGMLRPGSAPADPDARRATTSPSRPTARLDVVDLLDMRPTKNGGDMPGTRDLQLDKQQPAVDPTAKAQHYRDQRGRRLGILGTLGLWVMLARGELIDSGQHPPRCCQDDNGHTVTGECGWLLNHLDWLLDMHPDFADDVAWMHRDLTRAVGERPDKPVPCKHCGGHVDGKDDNAWFECRGCGKSWLWAAEMARIGKDATKMLTLRQIATQLAVPLQTLKNAAGERFLPVGKNAAGSKLYDIDVVRRAQHAAEKAAKAGGKSGRKRSA